MKVVTRPSIHQRIGLLFALLGTLVLLLVIAGLMISINGWLNARLVAEHNNIATHTLEGVKHFTFERGRTNVILRGGSLISEKNRDFIEERRAKGDAAIRAAIAAATLRFPQATGEVEKAWASVITMRTRVEKDFITQANERNPQLPQQWMGVANELVAKLEGLLVRASQVENADYSFTQLANLRIYALQFRNVVGAESTRLAGELSASRIPDSKALLDAARLRGDAQRTWTYIEQSGQAIPDKEIAAAITKVKQQLTGGLRPLQDKIIDAAGLGKLPDFTIDAYTQAAVPALDAIIEMVDSVDKVTQAYVSNRQQIAGWWLAGSVSALLLLMGFLILAKRDLADHLIQPLQSILRRIRALGGINTNIPNEKLGDLAAIDHALDVLEESLSEIERSHENEETSRAALQKSEKRLRAAIDTIGEAFVIYDVDDRLAYCNEEYRKVYPSITDVIVLGNTFEHIIRTWAERGLCPEPDIEAWIKKRIEAHQNGAVLIQKTDGGRWMRIVERPTPDGEIVGFRVDITELVDAKEAAESSDRAKSLFLATMSHEIRTPMNGILGMAQMLLMDNIDEVERRDFARTILNSGQTLLTLLNDILDFSKIEAGKLELEKSVIDPDQILRETANLFQENAANKGLTLEAHWEGQGTVQRYLADPNRLRQMLSNLTNNAIKFTTTGTISLRAREIERSNDAALLEFSVSDTGIGIGEDKLELLFKPFSQADSTITRQFGGTGLGLSIVRSLALKMGGDVGVESISGQGSRFWFRILADLVHEDMDRRSSTRAVEEIAVASRQFIGNILVVEDNSTNQKVIQALLGKLGLGCQIAPDGKAGFQAVEQDPSIDLILMDVQMPVMDGYEATRAIRAWETDTQQRHRSIIALTADAFEEDRQRCINAGMDDFLAKPLSLDKLTLALQRWLPAKES